MSEEYDLAVFYRHKDSPLSKQKFNPLTITRCLAQVGFIDELHFFPMRDHRLKKTNRIIVVASKPIIIKLLNLHLLYDYFRIETFRWDQYQPPATVNGIQLSSTHWKTREFAGTMARRIIDKIFKAIPNIKRRYRVFVGERKPPTPNSPSGEVLYHKIVIFRDDYPPKVYRLVLELAKTLPYQDYKVVYSLDMRK